MTLRTFLLLALSQILASVCFGLATYLLSENILVAGCVALGVWYALIAINLSIPKPPDR